MHTTLQLVVLASAITILYAAPMQDAPAVVRPGYPRDIDMGEPTNHTLHKAAMQAKFDARHAKHAAKLAARTTIPANGGNLTRRGAEDTRSLWLGHTPYAAPQYFPKGAAVIILMWDVTEYTAQDLDSILLDPLGCIVSAKYGAGFCQGSGLGWAELGSITPIYWEPYGGTYTSYSDPVEDSKTQPFTTDPAGVEEITIWSPETTGSYKHCAYNYAGTIGYDGFEGPSVVFWTNDVGTGVTPHYQSFVDDATYSQTCEGRFWNTFHVSFTVSSDDDSITGFSITSVETVTSTPATTFGTTSWFNWEASPRTNIGC